jgi:hypothetical protein
MLVSFVLCPCSLLLFFETQAETKAARLLGKGRVPSLQLLSFVLLLFLFLTYCAAGRNVGASWWNTQRERSARIARNARNRVRGVIGMSNVQRAFGVSSAIRGLVDDDDDDGLVRPSLQQERAAAGQGMSAIAAVSAFSTAGSKPRQPATSRTPRELPTVEEDSQSEQP